jgi:Fe-S cluster assembly ATP-binding protein
MGKDLIIKNLHASVDGNEVLKGVTLTIKQGEVHALMGPNGSGKSTLSHVILGHPAYKVTKGSIQFDGKDVLRMAPEERAKAGLFLSFQYPTEIEGVTLSSFLRTAYNTLKGENLTVLDFHKKMLQKMEMLKMDKAFGRRYLNYGFSGGEKKRCEVLQMAVLEPTLAILDEPDSGLDVDALQVVAQGINTLAGKQMGALIITHYNRILNYVKPKYVHVFAKGKILKTGDHTLALELESKALL